MHPNGITESISFSPDTTDIHIPEGTGYGLKVNYYAYHGIKSIEVFKVEDGVSRPFIVKQTDGFDSETNAEVDYWVSEGLDADSVMSYRFEMVDIL